MSSTAGNDTAKDSMDEIKAVPEQRSQGTSPPSLLGSYFEAGDEDKGEPLGSTQLLDQSWQTGITTRFHVQELGHCYGRSTNPSKTSVRAFCLSTESSQYSATAAVTVGL